MEKMPDAFGQEDPKDPKNTNRKRFKDFDATGITDYNEYFEKKFAHLKEEFKIKNLDDLLVELKRIINGWHQMTDINETDLREREMVVYEALTRLKLDQDWKNKHSDLFVDYLQVGDSMHLIKFVEEEFNLQQIESAGGLAARQVLDEIEREKIVNREEGLDKESTRPRRLFDPQKIIKNGLTSKN